MKDVLTRICFRFFPVVKTEQNSERRCTNKSSEYVRELES